jgi:hypothetical protein
MVQNIRLPFYFMPGPLARAVNFWTLEKGAEKAILVTQANYREYFRLHALVVHFKDALQ